MYRRMVRVNSFRFFLSVPGGRIESFVSKATNAEYMDPTIRFIIYGVVE